MIEKLQSGEESRKDQVSHLVQCEHGYNAEDWKAQSEDKNMSQR